MSTASSGAVVAEATVLNLLPPSKVATGICFLDHMVDQLTSHAMLGVTLRCGLVGGESAPRFFAPLEDYARELGGQRPHDRDIAVACGTALGLALRAVVKEVEGAAGSAARGMAVFCAPLDEAFAEAKLTLHPPAASCGRCLVSLAPYGAHASRGGDGAGRRWIGRFRTELTPVFWSALAGGLGCDLSLRRVRGGNAHHQLESAFKSFARVFRAALDSVSDPGGGAGVPGCATFGEQGQSEAGAGAAAPPPPPPPAEPRRAERRRATKETAIEVRLDLDKGWAAEDPPRGAGSVWGSGEAATPSTLRAATERTPRVSTGVAALDRVLSELSRAGGFELVVWCDGDRHIDDHHTAEDVAITVGQCLHEALGDKAGLARMGCAEGTSAGAGASSGSGSSGGGGGNGGGGGCGGGGGGARVRAVLDLSNRPHFESDLPLDEEYVGGGGGDGSPCGGDACGGAMPLCGTLLSCEMLHHVFLSLTMEARASVHLELREDGCAPGHTLDLALAAARAYGAALGVAIRLDPRRRGKVASSKGTLSK